MVQHKVDDGAPAHRQTLEMLLRVVGTAGALVDVKVVAQEEPLVVGCYKVSCANVQSGNDCLHDLQVTIGGFTGIGENRRRTGCARRDWLGPNGVRSPGCQPSVSPTDAANYLSAVATESSSVEEEMTEQESKQSPVLREESDSKSDSGFKRGGAPSTEYQEGDPSITLYVSGVSRSVDEQQLNELFSKYGKLTRCEIVRDPHLKESRGFGFVAFDSPAAADEAIAGLHNLDFHGRVLAVERAKRARPRTPTPGRYLGPPSAADRRRRDDRYHDGYYGRRDEHYQRQSYDPYRGSYYSSAHAPPPADYYGRQQYPYYPPQPHPYASARAGRYDSAPAGGSSSGYYPPPPPSNDYYSSKYASSSYSSQRGRSPARH